MDKSTKEQINDTLLSILVKNSLYVALRLLALIGKPFYFLLTYTFLTIVFALQLAKTAIILLSKLLFFLLIRLHKFISLIAKNIISLKTQLKIIFRKKNGTIFPAKEKKYIYYKRLKTYLSRLAKLYSKYFLPLAKTLKNTLHLLAITTIKFSQNILSLFKLRKKTTELSPWMERSSEQTFRACENTT